MYNTDPSYLICVYNVHGDPCDVVGWDLRVFTGGDDKHVLHIEPRHIRHCTVGCIAKGNTCACYNKCRLWTFVSVVVDR